MEKQQKIEKRDRKDYPKFLFKLENIEFPERFNSAQFGPYEHPETGKTIFLINPDGKAIESGFLTSQMNLLFDTYNISHAQRVRFLLDHPDNIANGGVEFSLTNIGEEAKNKDNDLINELELEAKVMSLGMRELRAVASALMLSYQSEKIALQASVIRRIRTPQSVGGSKTEPGYVSVQRIVNSKKTLVLLDVTQMLEYKIIKINNSGIYVHGNHNLGLNAEQVVVYFEKDQALFGLLKAELRKKLAQDNRLDDAKKDLDLNL